MGGKTSQSFTQGPIGEDRPSAESIWRSVKQYLGVKMSCRFDSSHGSTNSDNARGAENDVSGTLARLKPIRET